jgi:flagellar biosynthesis protein FliR
MHGKLVDHYFSAIHSAGIGFVRVAGENSVVETTTFALGIEGIFFRALGAVAILPLGTATSGLLKRVMIALLAVLLFAGRVPAVDGVSANAIVGEFVTGILLSLPLALMVMVARMLGELFDVGRGQTISSLYDPGSMASVTPSALLLRWYVWVQLLVMGVFEPALVGFVKSFSVTASGTASLSDLIRLGVPLCQMIAITMSKMFLLFMPMSVLFLAVDFAVGCFGKLLPGLQLQAEMFQLKTYLGFGLCIALLQWAPISELGFLAQTLSRAALLGQQ